MRKSPENAMPYARESPDKEKTNHKNKISQNYITMADPSNSRVIMACNLYCSL